MSGRITLIDDKCPWQIGTGADILQVADFLHQVCARTEVRPLSWLKRIAGIDAFGKFENQQVTGSFKFRGAYNRLARVVGGYVVAASAGNHGLAVAEAAVRLGLNATLCVPKNASPAKYDRLASYKHAIVREGTSLEEATTYARQLADARGWEFISPYNDRFIVLGQATVALEFLRQVESLDTILVPAGGGGLLAGTVLTARCLRPGLRVIGVEPERYPSISESIRCGAAVRVPNLTTLADGLAVNLDPESVTLGLAREADLIVTVTEEEIAAALVALLHYESQLVEPSGVAALAAVLAGKVATEFGRIGIVLSGGNVSKQTLMDLLLFPFSDAKLFPFINRVGARTSHSPAVRGYSGATPTSPEPASAESVGGQAQDAAEDLIFLSGRMAEIDRKTAAVLSRLREYEDYCRAEKLESDKVAIRATRELADMLNDARSAVGELNLDPTVCHADYADRYTQYFQAYRSMLHLLLPMSMCLDWRSQSYKQTRHTMFFGLETQNSPGVNYNRYEGSILPSLERDLCDVLAFDQREVAALLTSSGMAAYTLLEAFLLRNALRPGDTILVPHYVYFETHEQLTQLPGVTVHIAETHDADEIVELVNAIRPRVIFLDPLTNTLELRLTDVPSVIRRIAALDLDDDMFVVVDGTMTSGAASPFVAPEQSRVKVLYYESGSKYLQLGLDMAMAGLAAFPVEYGPAMDRLRRNTGTILYDSAAHTFPRYGRDTHIWRMKRFTRNALLVADEVRNDPALTDVVRPIYPRLPCHPDHRLAENLDWVGGVLTFHFLDSALNQRGALNSFIEVALTVARQHRVNLTKGVSFGFSLPRISAAAAMSESSPPFLRLSVGDRSRNETTALARTLREALGEFARAARTY